MYEIKNPEPAQYYIANTKEYFSYGKIESNQVLSTGLDNIETFIEEGDFLKRLEELDIEPDGLQ